MNAIEIVKVCAECELEYGALETEAVKSHGLCASHFTLQLRRLRLSEEQVQEMVDSVRRTAVA